MILAIDSSGRETLLGLSKNSTIHELRLPDRDRLQSAFYELLSTANVTTAEIAAIAIGAGPGSFTGLRVGYAFAQGLARGLDVPLWPVPSLEVVAHNLLPNYSTVNVLVQARKERWFVQSFGENIVERAVVDAAGLALRLPEVGAICGPGCATLPDELKVRWQDRIATDEHAHRPHAEALIRLAQDRWQNRERLKISNVLPDYGLEFGAN